MIIELAVTEVLHSVTLKLIFKCMTLEEKWNV